MGALTTRRAAVESPDAVQRRLGTHDFVQVRVRTNLLGLF